MPLTHDHKEKLVTQGSWSPYAFRRWLVLFVKAMVTASLIVWLCVHFDVVHAFSLLQQVHPGYVASALALTLSISGLSAWRRQTLLRVLQISLPFHKLWSVTLISNLFQYSLPGIGGDEAAKLYYVAQATRRRLEPLLSAGLDGAIGLVAWISIPLVLMPFGPANGRLREAGGIVYVVLLIGLLLSVSLGLLMKRYPVLLLSVRIPTRVATMLQALRHSLELCGQHKRLLLQTAGLAIASNLLRILIYYNLATALAVESRFLDCAFVLPMVTLAALLPISFGGLGVHEWTFIALFTELGMPRQTALSISLLRLVLQSAMMLLGAVLYLTREKTDHG